MEKKYEKCKVCHMDNVIHYGTYKSYTGIKCQSCGFITTTPIPSTEELKEFYEADYYNNYAGGSGYNSIIKKENKDYDRKVKLIERYINKNANVLEIGAANGIFLKKLKERGYDNVTGCDLSKDANHLGKELGVDIITTDIHDDINNKWVNQFDAVVAWATIEHVPDPVKFSNRCFDFLKKDGFLIIDTGIADTIREKKLKKGLSSWYYPPEHLHVFTLNSFINLFKENKIVNTLINYDRPFYWKLLSILDAQLRILFKASRNDVWDKILVIVKKMDNK